MALTQIKTTGIADNAVTDAKVVDAITSSNHLPLAGGTMTGVLNMNSQNITNAGTIQGTLSTASQTNITSVGTLSGLTVNSNLLTLSHSSLDTRLKIEASASNRAGILQLLGGSSDKVAIDFGQSGGTGDLGRIRYDISSNTMNFINGDHNAPELILSTSSATFAGQALIKEGASNDLSLAFSNDTDTGIYRGGDGATAFVQNAGIALELQSSLTAEFRGLIKHKGTSNDDYGNTAFETRAGNNSQGVKISHGGGNGKLEIFGGNQSRTQFYANQITANVNGLEIKTTDGQSLTLGTNNSTRVTVDSSGNATFAEKILMTKESVIQQVADETKGFMFSGGGGTNFGYPNVQGSGLYGMVFGRESINESGGGHYIAKSHWGGISIIGFSGSGVQGIDIVAWGYGNGGATVLKSGNWVGSLYRSYSTVNYHLVVDVGTTVTMFSILIGI